MLTSLEINQKIKSGVRIFARVEGDPTNEHRVLMTRVGLKDILQVQIRLNERPVWRNCNWSSVRVEEQEPSPAAIKTILLDFLGAMERQGFHISEALVEKYLAARKPSALSQNVLSDDSKGRRRKS